jgi:hypothetical protein
LQYKKIKEISFLIMFMENQRQFPLQHAKAIYISQNDGSPITFCGHSHHEYTLLLLFTRNPGEEMILFHIEEEEGRERARERRHDQHHHLKLLLSSTMLCE